jgi:hypothetical protein
MPESGMQREEMHIEKEMHNAFASNIAFRSQIKTYIADNNQDTFVRLYAAIKASSFLKYLKLNTTT